VFEINDNYDKMEILLNKSIKPFLNRNSGDCVQYFLERN
jgi:hypothetical protein